MTNVGWYHPNDESDQWDGFNDSGIEQFRGNPIVHLAREINQNAIDAADSGTVEVTFRLHEVDPSSIPNFDQYKENLEDCLTAAQDESDKAKSFFESALKLLNRKKIFILEASDHNTQGMRGPSENGTPFYAFVKAKGQSKKVSDTAAGSYGIGKFAPYAVSGARTIFVSTVYQDKDGQWHQLTQGKSILMSHNKNGYRKQGVGFWGAIDKCKPISGISAIIPVWMARANNIKELPLNKGTKISILCFDPAKYWEEILAASVAENFFGAIIEGKLRVKISDKYDLNEATIIEFFENKAIRKTIESLKNEPEQFDNCSNYLAALTNKTEVFIEESQTKGLGLCQIRILINEGLPKKVCALRNGMFISDSLNRLKSFSEFKEFVAVVQCLNQKGNQLLRAMEPPRHDDFEPDRLTTKEDQKRGAKALAELAKWIREMLKRHAKDPVSEVTEIEELKDFFGDEGDKGSGSGAEEINPYGDIIIRAKQIKQNFYAATAGDGDGKGDGDGGDGGGGGAGKGGGHGQGGKGSSGGGTGGGTQKPNARLDNIRSIIETKKSRKIAFTPEHTGNIALQFMEAGSDSDFFVEAVKTDQGEIKDGKIILNSVAGKRYNLSVELNEDFTGAIKVIAHEI